jgi:hypothetical protein
MVSKGDSWKEVENAKPLFPGWVRNRVRACMDRECFAKDDDLSLSLSFSFL